MIYNNLNRVKGILSARQGAEIPKFTTGGTSPIMLTVTSVQQRDGKYYINGDANYEITQDEANFLQNQLNLSEAASLVSTSGSSTVTYQYVPKTPQAQPTQPVNTSVTVQGTTDQGSPASTVEPEKTVDPRIVRGRQLMQDRQAGIVPVDLSMKIPGGLEATPYTAVENAARHNEISRQVVDEMIAERRAATTTLPEVNVTATNPNATSTVSTLNVQPLSEKLTPEEISAGIRTTQEKQKKVDEAKIQQRSQNWQSAGQALGAGIQAIGGAMGAQQATSDSNTTKNITAAWDGAANIASQFGPIGEAVGAVMGIAKGAGDIIQGITGGTDQITKTDQWMSSPLLSWNVGIVNDLFAKKTEAFGMDTSAVEAVGSSYGGSVSQISDAAKKADKKVGLLAGKERRQINSDIANARASQARMRGVADTATDQRLAVQSMGEQAGLAYSIMTDGGYNQKYTYAAKHGGLLEWNPVAELEWEPQVELNWELPTFKVGGSVEFVEELEWIPEFKDGGKTEESDVPEIEETTQKNVIPEGALHKNKHHMEHAEGLTKKGIPVVDEDGEQQAEIEHSEIIFTLEVTKKLEEYYEIFYSEESTNKEKEQAALDAGKLLVYQILENTEDRTGLIESCKKGGTLTFKKDTEELIEEVLEWMPTVVVVETEELKENQEGKPKKKEVDNSKEELKQIIKEVLVELIVK